MIRGVAGARRTLGVLRAVLYGVGRNPLSLMLGAPRRGFARLETFDDGDARFSVSIERVGEPAGCSSVSVLIGGSPVLDMDLRGGSGFAWLVKSRGAVIPAVSRNDRISIVFRDSVVCSGRFRNSR